MSQYTNENDFYHDNSGEYWFPMVGFPGFMLKLHYEFGTNLSIAMGIRVKGQLYPERLEAAIQKLFCRHDAFRMVFHIKDDAFYYSILKKVDFKLEVLDTIGDTDDERYSYAKQKIDEDARDNIDVIDKLCVRFRCWRINDTDHIVYVNAHHVIYDVVSLFNTVNELFREYAAPSDENCEDCKLELHEYYAGKQALLKEKGDEYNNYWAAQTEGYSWLKLPVPSESVSEDSQKLFHITLDRQKLERASRKMRVSPFAVITAAYHLCLYKAFGEKDTIITFGCVDRIDLKNKDIVGPLVLGLPNRIKTDPEESFASLVKRTAKKAQENMGYCAYVPLPAQLSSQFAITYANQNSPDINENMSIVLPDVARKYEDFFMLCVNNTAHTIEIDMQCDLTRYDHRHVRTMFNTMRYALMEADRAESFTIDSVPDENAEG